MGRDEQRRWGTVPSRGGESVGKTPADGGKRQNADGPGNDKGLAATPPDHLQNPSTDSRVMPEPGLRSLLGASGV